MLESYQFNSESFFCCLIVSLNCLESIGKDPNSKAKFGHPFKLFLSFTVNKAPVASVYSRQNT